MQEETTKTKQPQTNNPDSSNKDEHQEDGFSAIENLQNKISEVTDSNYHFGLVIYPDKMLGVKSVETPSIDDEVKAFSGVMSTVCNKFKGLGVSAVQLGVPLRMFYLNTDDYVGVLVNPAIYIEDDVYDPHTEIDNPVIDAEGCLSLPRVSLKIPRHESITLTGLEPNGSYREMELSGLSARVAQHEYDHLEGILIINRVSWVAKDMAARKVKKWTLAAKKSGRLKK